MAEKKDNPMRRIRIEKVVVNIGVGEPGERLEKAKTLLQRLTGAKVVETEAKKKIPKWGIRPGLKIGVKVTLRGKAAEEFLNKALDAVDRKIKESSFDEFGNFSFQGELRGGGNLMGKRRPRAKHGKNVKCQRCGRPEAVIRKYGLMLCRHRRSQRHQECGDGW